LKKIKWKSFWKRSW